MNCRTTSLGIIRPALFLDRDGVINVDHGHVHRLQDFELITGAATLVSTANAAGLAVVVITNQGGIAKGLYGEPQYQQLTAWMQARLQDAGAHIDAVYHCPHHPQGVVAALALNCACRKPKPGLLLRAAADLSLDLERSILVGDKTSDLWAGDAAGVPHLYLYEGPGGQPRDSSPSPAHATFIQRLDDAALLTRLTN